MRNYILTEQEREIIEGYIGKGFKIEGFSMLKHRIQKNLPQIKQDLTQINDFLRTFKERENRIKANARAEK